MTPSLSVPTDNLYKFASIFGLALIIAAILSLVAVYTSTLSEKIRLADAIHALEAIESLPPGETVRLELRKHELKVRKANEDFANCGLLLVLAAGVLCSLWGFGRWTERLQKHADRTAELHLKRLALEVEELEARVRPKPMAPEATATVSA